MKKLILLFTFIIISVSILSCQTKPDKNVEQISEVIPADSLFHGETDLEIRINFIKEYYVPKDKKLFDEIVAMDKEFSDAFNQCDLEKQALFYSDKIEILHDKGGLMDSKKDILEATVRDICGKVTRELIEGTVEVYPINNYGAVQTGYHIFHNNQEPNATSNPSLFTAVWHNENGE